MKTRSLPSHDFAENLPRALGAYLRATRFVGLLTLAPWALPMSAVGCGGTTISGDDIRVGSGGGAGGVAAGSGGASGLASGTGGNRSGAAGAGGTSGTAPGGVGSGGVALPGDGGVGAGGVALPGDGGVGAGGVALPGDGGAGSGGRALPADGGAGGGSLAGDAGTSCVVSGVVYADGASFKASDGCNTCSCSHGAVRCTTIACTANTCGGLAGGTCDKGQYCKFPESTQCGAGDQTGTCTAIPETCTDLDSSVCGCDGKTYASACTAALQGVSIASSDACAVSTACGARAGNACKADEYCAYVEGQSCGAADAESVCTPRPQTCTSEDAPVCACDGKTYDNSCAAAMAGTGVEHAGACSGSGRSCVVGGVTYPDGSESIPASDGCNLCSCTDGALACTTTACPTKKLCGGLLGATCGSDEYCAYVEGQHCGAADVTATCKTRPEGCTDQVDQVCGCDGSMYSNSCEAARAGTGVLQKGACP